jgi:nicotinic acid mononucleotide adenylyltransferase
MLTHNFSNRERERLSNDVFYWSMFNNQFSYEDLIKSGWLATDYSFETMNELQKLPNPIYPFNLNEKNEYCNILLSTGSYAPAHEGHIEMMIEAQKIFEEHFNEKIDALILSPSHDRYVQYKAENTHSWHIERRIEVLKEKLSKYPCSEQQKSLFLIDEWESKKCNCDVNFTDVIIQVEKQMQKHTNKPIRIYYVFGSDYPVFLNVFQFIPKSKKQNFGCVMVGRDNFPVVKKLITENILYTFNKLFSNKQSKMIRANEQ